MKRQFWHLSQLVQPYLGRLIVAVAAVVASALLGLVFPGIIGMLVDSAFNTAEGTAAVDRVALLLLGIFILENALSIVYLYLLAAVGERMIAALRAHLYAHVLMLPIKFFDQNQTGTISSRLTSDISVLQTVITSQLSQFIRQAIILVGSLIFLFAISPPLTLVVLAFMPFIVGFSLYFGGRLQTTSTEFQDHIGASNATAEESLAAVRVVQWFSAERSLIKRYRGLIDKTLEIALKRARIYAAFIPLVTMLFATGIVAVLWLGGRMVQAEEISGGDLVAFLLYGFTIAEAIVVFSTLFSEIQRALGASRRVFELLDNTTALPEPAQPQSLNQVSGALRFQEVGFRYDSRQDDILQAINLDIEPGEAVALVGRSGAGKSTLINLISRFYDPTEGAVMLDGIDLRALRLRDLRAQMAAVPQEAQLLYGSVADNIRLGKPDATLEEVIAAAKAANADDFIQQLDQQYDTLIGERGMQLSGGQRQRIAIARAVLCDPLILILDEATSALDNESEAVVQAALDQLMTGRTTIVIAHRLSTVRNADRIVVLDQGRISEIGTHDQLLAQQGLYAELYQHQFREDKPVQQPAQTG